MHEDGPEVVSVLAGHARSPSVRENKTVGAQVVNGATISIAQLQMTRYVFSGK